MENERIPPNRDRTLIVCVIYQQGNHYTTPTADSVNEINYLYMHPCLLWETSVVKSSNCFQRCIVGTAKVQHVFLLLSLQGLYRVTDED